MQVFLDTDMLALTPPLLRLCAGWPRIAEDGIDATIPPCGRSIAPVSKSCSTRCRRSRARRCDSAKAATSTTGGWPYRSEMAVRSDASQRCCAACSGVRSGRGRSCSAAGPSASAALGRLRVDPDDIRLGARRHRLARARRLDQVHRRRLFQLPAAESNTRLRAPSTPRRASGEARVRRLRRVSRFLGEEHARALRRLPSVNPHIVGTYVLTQFGGRCAPARARSIRSMASGCGPTPTSSSPRTSPSIRHADVAR